MDEPNTDPVVNTHRFYCLLLHDLIHSGLSRKAFDLIQDQLLPFLDGGKGFVDKDNCPEPILDLFAKHFYLTTADKVMQNHLDRVTPQLEANKRRLAIIQQQVADITAAADLK